MNEDTKTDKEDFEFIDVDGAKYIIRKPTYIPINTTEWISLKNDIDKIDTSGRLLGKLTFSFFALALTPFVGWITSTSTQKILGMYSKTICLIFTIILILCGSLSLILAIQSNKRGGRSKTDIIATMKRIEDDFKRKETQTSKSNKATF